MTSNSPTRLSGLGDKNGTRKTTGWDRTSMDIRVGGQWRNHVFFCSDKGPKILDIRSFVPTHGLEIKSYSARNIVHL